MQAIESVLLLTLLPNPLKAPQASSSPKQVLLEQFPTTGSRSVLRDDLLISNWGATNTDSC